MGTGVRAPRSSTQKYSPAPCGRSPRTDASGIHSKEGDAAQIRQLGHKLGLKLEVGQFACGSLLAMMMPVSTADLGCGLMAHCSWRARSESNGPSQDCLALRDWPSYSVPSLDRRHCLWIGV